MHAEFTRGLQPFGAMGDARLVACTRSAPIITTSGSSAILKLARNGVMGSLGGLVMGSPQGGTYPAVPEYRMHVNLSNQSPGACSPKH